jgi:hypothetical protein
MWQSEGYDIQEFRNFKKEIEQAFSKLLNKKINMVLMSPIDENGEVTMELKEVK